MRKTTLDDLILSTAKALQKHVVQDKPERVLIVAGPARNGDYGLMLAHLLSADTEIEVTVVCDSLQGHRYQLKLLEDKGEIIEAQRPAKDRILEAEYIVDCVYGIELEAEMPFPYNRWIQWINEAQAPVLSCDVPSGTGSDNGSVFGEAVFADKTVAIQLPKPGLYLYPASEHSGKIVVEDIGFSQDNVEANDTVIEIHSTEEIVSKLPPRKKHSHKGSYGKVLLIAGSEKTSGAALLCAKSILKCGGGLLTVFSYPEVISLIRNNLFEAMTVMIDEQNFSWQLEQLSLGNYSLVVIGPGLGINFRTEQLLERVLKSDLPCVIDADALFFLKHHLSLLKRKALTVITPHEAEYARIFEFSRETLVTDLQRITGNYPNLAVVFKCEHTLVACKEKIFINTTGNNALAKGGSGDVLAGVIAAFLAQKTDLDSVVAAVYLHSLAADYWVRNNSQYSLLAGDLIEMIDKVILKLTRSIKQIWLFLNNAENVQYVNSDHVSGIILADKKYSSSINENRIGPAQINMIKERGYQAIVKMDRLFEEEELASVSEYLRSMEEYGADMIIYTDLAVKVLIEQLNLKVQGIYAPETLLTNYYDIKSLKNDGVDGCVISKDIPLKDVYEIINEVKDYCYLRIHGPILIAYSRRQYINAYLDSQKEYLDHYYLQEESREERLPVVEKESGNWLYGPTLQSINEISRLLNSYVRGLIIDNCFMEDEYSLKITEIYDLLLNGLTDAEAAYDDLIGLDKTINYIDINDLKDTRLDKEQR